MSVTPHMGMYRNASKFTTHGSDTGTAKTKCSHTQVMTTCHDCFLPTVTARVTHFTCVKTGNMCILKLTKQYMGKIHSCS